MSVVAKLGAAQETAKLSPPVAVAIAPFMGVPLETWVITATLIYTVLLIVHKGWTMYWDVREKREERAKK